MNQAATHPVSEELAAARRAVARLADQPMWAMDATATRTVLRDLAALTSQAAELESRVLAHAETVEAYHPIGATSVAAGLAVQTRTTRADARARTRFATTLDAHEQTRLALRRGEIRTDQAEAICAAVDDLPAEDVAGDPGLREQAEKHLLAQAEQFDAQALKRLARRLLEVADPARADEHEADRLEREEREALRRTRITFSDDGHGTTRGRFALPTAQASVLRKMLHAFAAPKHRRATHGAGSYDHTTALPDRMGQALCDLIERYPARRLPDAGGVNAAVVVTMTLETLLGGLRAASLDTGVRISAPQARRLACEAGIIPVVLGGSGIVLDVGRKRRLHTRAMRLARLVELSEASPLGEPTCEHPTCDVPAAWTQAHHEVRWAHRGGTNHRQLQLLCPRHHSLVHGGARQPDPPLRR